MLAAQRRARPDVRLALLAPARAALADFIEWDVLTDSLDDVAEAAEKLTEDLRSSGDDRWIVVLENLGDFVNSDADGALQELVKVARLKDHLVVAEGDTQSVGGSWGIAQAVRYSRRGIVLQPDQTDGDNLFRATFPRVNRADFPQGRGLHVSEGRVSRVQVVLP
jgi:S-DNA-T family DNA segregation ATPase FtsK/SpoIIIE